MSNINLIDTGPLVALFNRKEMHHKWCVELISRLEPPLITCEPVITEAAFLLSRDMQALENLLALFDRGILSCDFRLQDQISTIRGMMNKYANVPMSLADACLVRLSELYPDCRLITFDSDFSIYRRLNRKQIPLCSPNLA